MVLGPHELHGVAKNKDAGLSFKKRRVLISLVQMLPLGQIPSFPHGVLTWGSERSSHGLLGLAWAKLGRVLPHHHTDLSSWKPNLQPWVFISLSSNVQRGEKSLTFPCVPSPFTAPTHSGTLTTRRVRSLSLWRWLARDPQCGSFGIWGSMPGYYEEGTTTSIQTVNSRDIIGYSGNYCPRMLS